VSAKASERTPTKLPKFGRRALAGVYSFRFAGFGRLPAKNAFHVAGVGRLVLHVDGTVSGEQVSSSCPMTEATTGNQGVFRNLSFTLSGSYSVGTSGTGTVTINFSHAGQVVQSDIFAIVATDIGATRFSLISTQPKNAAGVIVEELVSGEAVRLL
jgi:hypothetical protein